MVWQLSLLFTEEPPGNTQFPICETLKDFDKRGISQISALNEDLKNIIKELQPFNIGNPRTHGLWIMNRLANDDKHRYPTIVNAFSFGFGASSAIAENIFIDFPVGPIKSGSILFKIDFSQFEGEFTPEIENSAEIVYRLGVALKLEDEPTLLPLHSTLFSFGEAVEKIAKRFEPYFVDGNTGL